MSTLDSKGFRVRQQFRKRGKAYSNTGVVFTRSIRTRWVRLKISSSSCLLENIEIKLQTLGTPAESIKVTQQSQYEADCCSDELGRS